MHAPVRCGKAGFDPASPNPRTTCWAVIATSNPEFIALASTQQARCAAYRALVDQQLDPALLQAIRDATNSGYPLASEPYKMTVLSPLGCKMQPGKPGPRIGTARAVYAVKT
jgi:hypothetical protein